MPLTAFGTLSIVASHDIGDLGPRDGETVTYRIPFWWSVSRLAFRLALWIFFLNFALTKANRTWRAAAVLIPFALFQTLIVIMVRSDVRTVQQLAPIISAVVIGLTMICLLSYMFENSSGIVLFFLMLSIFGLSGIFSLLTASGSIAILPFILLFSFSAFTITGSFLLTVFAIKKWYTHGRLILFLPLIMILMSLFSVLFISKMLMASGVTMNYQFTIGFLIGASLYVLTLPFILLAVTNSYYRNRFFIAAGIDIR